MKANMLNISWYQLKEQICERAYTLIYLLAVALMSILFVACQPASPFECTDAIGCVSIAPDESLKLGVIQDLSGGAAVYGTEQLHSFELALADRDGQLLGHPIELQIEDEGCTPEGGANAALRVIADPQVVGILGTTCSSAASTVAKLMSEAGLVMVSGVNSAPSLTSIGGKPGVDWQPGYFRTMLNVVEEARAAAVFALQELGAAKAATINDGDTFSQGYADVFEQVFTEFGGEIVLEATVNKGDTDMHPVLLSVSTSRAEVIFLALFPPEGALIVQQTKTVTGLENLIFIGGGALRTDAFIESVGADGLGMYFIGSAPPPVGAVNDKLVSEYESRYGQPPQTVTYGYAYDAAQVLLKAIETVIVQDADGTLHIGRQAMRDALYATTDFEGVTGQLTCDEFGDCAVVRFDIVRLDDPTAGVEGLLSNVIYTYGLGQ